MWAKLRDDFGFHPKVRRAGNEAVGAWARMLTEACREAMKSGRPGFVDSATAFMIAGCSDVVDRLVECGAPGCPGLLEPVDGGYMVHDFNDFNDPEKIAELSERRAEMGRKGAQVRWNGKNGKQDGKCHSKGYGKHDGKVHGKSIADPDPDPVLVSDPDSDLDPESLSLASQAHPDSASPKSRAAVDSVDAVLDFYAEAGKPWSKQRPRSAKARNQVQARLKNWTPAELCKAIEAMFASPWHNGSDPKSTGRYLEIHQVMRGDERVEMFLGKAADGPKRTLFDMIDERIDAFEAKQTIEAHMEES